jgi:hypothetical protein
MRKKDEQRLEAYQVKFLRPIVGGASRRDHLHNEVIREHLGETSIVKDIQKYRLQLRNQVDKMEDMTLPPHQKKK